MMRIRAALILIFLLACTGCLNKPEPQTYDPLYDVFNEITLAGRRAGGATLVLDGFAAHWADAPHNVHRMGAGLVSALAIDNKLSGRALLAMEGETSSRSGKFDYNLDYSIVHTRDSMFYHGEVIDLPIINGDGRRDVMVDLNRNGFGGIPRENIAVFLRGFYLNTNKSDPDGLPVHRFAAGLENVRFDERGRLRFDAVMVFDPAARSDTRTDAKLFYTVVGARGGAVTEKSYKANLDSPDNASNAVTIQGRKGDYPSAFVGTRYISLEHAQGAYLVRSLLFRNTDFRYDTRNGAMRFVNRSGISGGGLFRGGARVRADFALVQLPGKDNSIRHTGFKGASKKSLVQKKLFSMRATTAAFHFPAKPAGGAKE